MGARLNIPKAQINSKLWAFFGVFAVKYTYFKPQNILIEAKNILMISYTYEAKICRTTPGRLLGHLLGDSLGRLLGDSLGRLLGDGLGRLLGDALSPGHLLSDGLGHQLLSDRPGHLFGEALVSSCLLSS